MAEVIQMKCENPQYSLAYVAKQIDRGCDGEPICIEEKNDGTAILLVMEQYYIRIGGYVSLSIMFTEEKGCHYATIVGSGGGTGLFNISWGANKSLAKSAVMLLEDAGFEKY